MLTRIQVRHGGLDAAQAAPLRPLHAAGRSASSGDRLAGGRPSALRERLLRRTRRDRSCTRRCRTTSACRGAQARFTGGEAIGEDTFVFFRALGVELKQFYGQTENCALTAAQSAATSSCTRSASRCPASR